MFKKKGCHGLKILDKRTFLKVQLFDLDCITSQICIWPSCELWVYYCASGGSCRYAKICYLTILSEFKYYHNQVK